MSKIIYCKYVGSLLDRRIEPTGETSELSGGPAMIHEHVRVDGKDYYVEKVVHDTANGDILLYVV
jgi:hypothetical protein